MTAPVSTDLDEATEALAARLVTAIEAADVDGWGAAFAPEAVAWHSYSGATMPAADNVELLRGIFAGLAASMRYDDVRRRRTRDGYVQQHTLRIEARTGAVFSVGVCQVVEVADGSVTRLEEYLDSGVLRFGAEQAPTPATH